MFELYYLPVHIEFGQEQPDLPGMMVRTAPRRAHRSRSQDVLIAMLTPFGGAHPGARVLESMLDEAVDLYYKSRGSVTSGLRSAAEHLNHLFLKYNAALQGNHRDGQIFAHLNLAALREDVLYIAQVGSTSTYILRPNQMQRFQGEPARGRGLGISRTAPIRYYQGKVEPESLLLVCTDSPAAWSEETLTRGNTLTVNLLRRRIVSTAEGDLQACIVQFKKAEQTAVHRLRPKTPVSPPFASPIQTDEDTPAEDLMLTATGLQDEPEPVGMQDDLLDLQTPPEKTEEEAAAVARDAAELDPELHGRQAEGYPEEPPKPLSSVPRRDFQYEQPREPEGETPEKKPRQRPRREPRKPDPARIYQRALRRQARRKKLAVLWQRWQGWRKRLSDGVRAVFARLLPGYSDESPQLSGGWMLFISIAIPLIVVTATITVYLRNGRGQQHQMYLEQAQLYAAEARTEEDPAAERSSWNQVFHWLDLAEEYRISDESELLRKQASAALDLLDGIERLEFNNLFPFGFSSTLDFVQIVSNDTEVYLLDSSQGRVLRLFLTGQGYELDNEFSCGPGASGTRLIGDLVDLIILPPGGPSNATVMGIDGSGNLLYCIPGAEAPRSGELTRPLDGWGEIGAIAYYQGTLYVLDPLYGAVYTYQGYNMEFGDEPGTFFDPQRDETIPNLRQMIDLAAYGEDLYLLNENGTIAWCTSGIFEGNQTRCDDPASFGDMRPGMDERTLIFPNAFFAQIQAAMPPDPSLFLLDVNAPAVYRFSLQLNLDRLFQPSQYSVLLLPQPPATAFSISPSRVLFLAYGNEVIYSSLGR